MSGLLLVTAVAAASSAELAPASVAIFTANDDIKTCYRDPVLLATSSGALLCFIEERFRGAAWKPSNTSGDHSCPDNYRGATGGHNLAYKRSTDAGKTWGEIVRIAGNLTNLAAKGAVDYTNNAVVEAKLPGGKRKLVYQYGSQNNPSFSSHGSILQRESTDDGLSWSWPPINLSATSASVGFPGATPGPAVGVQSASGRLLFCSWSNRSPVPFLAPGWGNASNFANMITWSDDFGATWQTTQPITGRGFNECFLALLPDGSDRLLEVSRRTHPDDSIPKDQQWPKPTYAQLTFLNASGDLTKATPVATMDAATIRTPICEGALLSAGGALWFSHPSSAS